MERPFTLQFVYLLVWKYLILKKCLQSERLLTMHYVFQLNLPQTESNFDPV